MLPATRGLGRSRAAGSSTCDAAGTEENAAGGSRSLLTRALGGRVEEAERATIDDRMDN